jgi:hypothetical protein
MVAANMCRGVQKEELMIRLAAETTVASLDSRHVRDATLRNVRCGEFF